MRACPVAQSCVTLYDPTDPGSSVHGIILASILEWVAISFSTSRVLENCMLTAFSLVFILMKHLSSQSWKMIKTHSNPELMQSP